MTRAQLVTQFLDSPESAARAVRGQSDLILGQPPDADTLSGDIAYLQAGASQLNLAVGTFSSSAFVARANGTVGGP